MNNINNRLKLIQNIIENKSIITFFQPIITVKSNRIMILESLSRGINLTDNSIVMPTQLFNDALKYNLVETLDLICVEQALKSFNQIKTTYKNVLISINISVNSIINNVDLEWLYKLTKKYEIDPHRIIIEILEDAKTDITILQNFANYYKDKGFLIALDDIGSGYSGLVRMSKIKPDIIKIDRSLIIDIDKNINNQAIVRSLMELGHRLGILVIAEGIEESAEAIKLLETGIDLHQGYYFHKPNKDVAFLFDNTQKKINEISEIYKDHIQRYIQVLDDLDKDRIIKIDNIISKIEKKDLTSIVKILLEIVNNDETIELLYILDSNGKMVTDTLGIDDKKIKMKHYIFKPAYKGEDFSLKEYFMRVKGKKEHYHSVPYISRATGIECVTFSKCFTAIDNNEYILCVDLMSLYSLCNLENI